MLITPRGRPRKLEPSVPENQSITKNKGIENRTNRPIRGTLKIHPPNNSLWPTRISLEISTRSVFSKQQSATAPLSR
jgi:hypothetical protein